MTGSAGSVGVDGEGGADGTGSAGIADFTGDLAIGGDFAFGDGSGGRPDGLLKFGGHGLFYYFNH